MWRNIRRSKKSGDDDDFGGGGEQYQELPCIPVKRAAVLVDGCRYRGAGLVGRDDE